MDKFVFVVCGAKEHIDELNFSLERLKRFTNNEIVVITDARRNKSEIMHDNILDIKTPDNFDNHQASIYLKTGVNKFLPKGHRYCYLDGDVVCISDKVDGIFDKYLSPITFAPDHAPFRFFSPYAVNCGCIEYYEECKDTYVKMFKKHYGVSVERTLKDENIKKQADELKEHLAIMKANTFLSLKYGFLRYFPFIKFFDWGEFHFNREKRFWFNDYGDIILIDYKFFKHKIMRQLHLTSKEYDRIFNFDTPHCNHLSSYLSQTYGINIPGDWQHWNGGVFLFDDSSAEFLDYWHEKTIAEFANPYTKTRDQGTLALSAWKFGLQNHPTLPIEYNWIAEFADGNIDYDAEKGYTRDGFKTISNPILMHIYHHWGDEEWSIWKSLNR
jgi:hypothetical protein